MTTIPKFHNKKVKLTDEDAFIVKR